MEPGDRRPIVLLACVYRVWAACRAHVMRKWLRDNGILVPGEACGPDVRAGELALRLAAARLLGGVVGGLALNWSKCYDRLPLTALADIAKAARMPQELRGPMLHAYGMPRMVRADGVASAAHKPSCGLAPGCPGATDWLALLVHLWKARIAAVSDRSEGRDYVDDVVATSTVSTNTPEGIDGIVHDVARFWHITDNFRAATTLTLNTAKSDLFGTAAGLRKALAHIGGPEVRDDLLDVGVVQLANRTASSRCRTG